MKHLITKGFMCPICNKEYIELSCLDISALPDCCKQVYLSYDHKHLYDKNIRELGEYYYKKDKFGNWKIVFEFNLFMDNPPKCLCKAEELLKNYYRYNNDN